MIIKKFDLLHPIHSLAKELFNQSTRMTKKELQEVLFFEEETTNEWTLDKCRKQYVIDQLDFIKNNMDDDWENAKKEEYYNE
tara:strand:+ start:1681 stop:1926 length:246 start_codon:yes stop_codon:yes gene_type:complete